MSEVEVAIWDGFEIPIRSDDAYERLYRGKEFAKWGPLAPSFCGTHGILRESRVLASRVRRLCNDYDSSFLELVARIKYIPNGQLKNFLVACRSCNAVEDGMSIAVVGSKSQEGSGIWHKYFIHYLLLRSTEITVHFIDPNELPSTWDCEIEGRRAYCRWIADAAMPSDLTAYDIVLSDVWNYSTVREWATPEEMKNKIFSLKGGKDDYDPFLHPAETRYFSHPPLGRVESSCPCMVCSAVADCSRHFDDFITLRSLCARLGCPSRCYNNTWVYDQNQIHKLRSQLISGGAIEQDPSIYRYIMAISTTDPVEMVGRVFIRGSKVQRLDPRTKEASPASVPTEFASQRVAFVGVDPSVVGEVASPSHITFTGSYDVMFVRSVTAWTRATLADRVYCADLPSRVESIMAGWKWTGSCFKEFYEYTLSRPIVLDIKKRQQVQLGQVYSLQPMVQGWQLAPPSAPPFVYYDGENYAVIDQDIKRSQCKDPRSAYSGIFYRFEDVDLLWGRLSSFSPLFSRDDLAEIFKDLSHYRRREWKFKNSQKVVYRHRGSVYSARAVIAYDLELLTGGTVYDQFGNLYPFSILDPTVQYDIR